MRLRIDLADYGYSGNIPLYGYIPHFVYSSSSAHLGCTYLLGTVNHAAVNMSVQIFV